MLKNPETRVCEFCETTFTQHATTQRFCSYDCRLRNLAEKRRVEREAERAAKAAVAAQ